MKFRRTDKAFQEFCNIPLLFNLCTENDISSGLDKKCSSPKTWRKSIQLMFDQSQRRGIRQESGPH